MFDDIMCLMDSLDVFVVIFKFNDNVIGVVIINVEGSDYLNGIVLGIVFGKCCFKGYLGV